METYNLAGIIKKIYDLKVYFYDLKSLKKIIGVKKDSSFYFILKKLLSEKILLKIERNKYLLNVSEVDDFSISGFLYSPSYISFETALNYYGILPQFSYEITSATTKKTTVKKIDGKVFSYLHIKKELFWGYEKKLNYLIALPEKALSDQLYFWAKGLKSLNIDEMNIEKINIKKLRKILLQYPLTRQTEKIYDILKKL